MKAILILVAMPALLLWGDDTVDKTGVAGSPHDFSDPHAEFSNACTACHVPHMQAVRPAGEAGAAGPALKMIPVSGQRRVYATDRYAPGPTSLICLACHDGTVGTSAIGSAHAVLAGVREGFGTPGGDGLRDHPIGVRYPANPRKFRPQAIVEAEGLIRLPDGRLECVSCHDPHNTSGTKKMLVMPNKRSRLCLSCHVK
ncbi:MAG: cytochrome c3 family protein [Phycisphaerae bacterium]|nr:cytochrome c3 family protein [Phycisphaerae bacterium]